MKRYAWLLLAVIVSSVAVKTDVVDIHGLVMRQVKHAESW